MLAPALTILLSSFLLFLVQPILAKQIVPWFGGSAGVWTICLVFFQVILLLGYTYAHWLTRHVARPRQFLLHIVLLALSCLVLPIIPSSFWRPGPDTDPTLRILGLLAATVGLPYFLLASTTPLLQSWLSGSSINDTNKRSIYRLFALSNFGSLVGLLSYPFSIEPFATARVQALVWSSGYALFAACLGSYAWRRRLLPDSRHADTTGIATPETRPPPRLYAYWVGCAALGSALLLSVTNQVTQNVASIPFLWVLPLSLYLLSFVICFEGRSGRGWYERKFWIVPAMLATGAMAWALFANRGNLTIFTALPVYAIGLLLGCILCHGELSRSKPHPDYLTHFYLSLAGGGALGGLLVGIVAPQVFNSYWELPLMLVALAALGVYACSEEIRLRPKTPWSVNFLAALLATALILLMLGELPTALDPYTRGWSKIIQGNARWGCAALLVMAALLLQRYRLWRAVSLTALLCTIVFDWKYHDGLSSGNQLAVRNFYGTLRVSTSPYRVGQLRWLKHGVILHGMQVTVSPQSEVPTTYFGESSGIGRTLSSRLGAVGSLRIGSVGLGAGTLAVYGKPGDVFRVYELNAAVLEIAENQFTYLKDSKARVEPVLGDARLSLEREISLGAFDKPERRFDVLSLDAFSGDAIPVHLLTREAFAIYVRTLKSDGVIAFHLSNTYLDLPPVVAQIARDAGFTAVLIADRPTAGGLTFPSDWVLVSRNTAFLQKPEIAAYATPIATRTGLPMWTDQFSNLFQILK
jgi:spermidine synthase